MVEEYLPSVQLRETITGSNLDNHGWQIWSGASLVVMFEMRYEVSYRDLNGCHNEHLLTLAKVILQIRVHKGMTGKRASYDRSPWRLPSVPRTWSENGHYRPRLAENCPFNT